MRYIKIETIAYEDINGVVHAIKDIRPYPTYTTMDTVTLLGGDRIDEIVSRQNYFGDGSEGDSYKVVDHNIVDLFENSFNLSGLRELRIPLR